MELQSYYWTNAIVPPADRDAVATLFSFESANEACRSALHQLLASSSVVARGIALDFYSMLNANKRHGGAQMMDDALEDAVRAAALRELEEPPYQRPEPGAWRGANHASALTALSYNAHPADAAVLARALRETEEPRVLEQGVWLAEPVLRGEPAHPQLVAVLAEIASREAVDLRTRVSALAAIGGCADEAVVPLLVARVADPELAVSAGAARALLERDLERHRALVAQTAAAWHPAEHPPYDVGEVRRLLGID